MNSKLSGMFVCMLSLVLCAPASAQFVEYFECDVEDPATFVATIDRFFNAMAGGVRPTLSVDAMIFNGENRATHRVVANFPDYRAFEQFRGRMMNSMAAVQLGSSIQLSSDCFSEGAVVERGYWGDREADIQYLAVYPSAVTDAGAYVEAFEDLMASSIGQQAPGSIILYEHRAGNQGVSHYVVFVAASFTALNQYLDRLVQSEIYADFVDDVRDIRELQTADQAQRIRTWEP